MNPTKQLTLHYDPLTIKHLGVSLYSQLPSVFSELVSNAYDADADNVQIEMIDNDGIKEIRVIDDGMGMTFQELNDKYLRIGRNRRQNQEDKVTPKGRKVIGKKGLGKLSVFGICNDITISTIKDGIENSFSMNLAHIESSISTYHPTIIKYNKVTTKENGTEIILTNLKRKSGFDLNSISQSLSKKFTILDTMKTIICLNDTCITLTNDMKFNELDLEFEWKFPETEITSSYKYKDRVIGKILTPKTPLKDTQMKGIYLTSRGKIVNEADFYGARDNDQVHSYMTGYLAIDFIDELGEDIISTDRMSLIWENDEAAELKEYIQAIIRKIGILWREKRKTKKTEEIKAIEGQDIQAWKDDLPTYEKKLASQIVNPILENPEISTKEASEIISGVIDKFDKKEFKDYASELADTVSPQELPKIIKLLNQWKITEAKEMSALATARVEVIKKFEKLLNEDTKEVPTLHDFLKSFSWLLDPRILEFKDEVTFSELLKTTYPEETLDVKDRRIDFLCSNALGGILYVIEIKRSNYSVDEKALEQAYLYGAFLKEKYATESSFSKVVCYVIGGTKSSNYVFKSKERSYSTTGEVFVKTYRELLEQSKNFHKEFIKAHES